jgi:signal transduction histidine kinase
VPRESTLLLASLPPPIRQQRLAAAVAVALFVAFLLVLPFRDLQGPREQAFIPIVDTVLCLTDLMTAVLLYAQFSVLRSRALLALAMGYLFTALIIVPHLLTFPGVFSPTGLLGAGLQSTVWLYIFWHLALPPAVITYTLLKRPQLQVSDTRQPVSISIVSSVAAVLVLVLALTVLVTAHEGDLPRIMLNATQADSFWKYVAAPAILGLSLLSIAILWRRRSSVLDLWLLVVLWAWFIETLLLSMTESRFSVVWYAGRAFGILSSSFVLLVLLYESTRLYARLALTAAAQDREREHQRLTLEVIVGSIAHELNQPLTAIMANGEAGVSLLSQQPPNVRETSAALSDIATEVRRASDIIRSIRDTVAGAARPMALIDMGQVVRETLALVRTELQTHDIAVELEIATALPPVEGNKVQLLQVILNLVTNALESMIAVTNRPRVLRICSRVPLPSKISITVQDTGVGIEPKDAARIFDPLFTTKAHGTGLGLAICQSIVEAHGGRISAARGEGYGSIFEILLPSYTLPSG